MRDSQYEKLFGTFIASYEAEAVGSMSLETYLAERMEEVDNTRWRINKFLQEEQEVETEYKQKLAAIQRERVKVWEACPHPSTTYYPDASGNNDSHTSCDICGVEI